MNITSYHWWCQRMRANLIIKESYLILLISWHHEKRRINNRFSDQFLKYLHLPLIALNLSLLDKVSTILILNAFWNFYFWPGFCAITLLFGGAEYSTKTQTKQKNVLYYIFVTRILKIILQLKRIYIYCVVARVPNRSLSRD